MGIRRLLVANRGPAAARVLRGARALGLGTLALHTEEETGAAWLDAADDVACLPGKDPRAAWLDGPALVALAREHGCDAVHPGWGFLAEDAGFARQVRAAGITFVGPDPEHLELFGDKTRTRAALADAGLPVGAGSGVLHSLDEAHAAAQACGWPVLVKPAAGGGGIGMQRVDRAEALPAALARARATAERAFGDARVYLEPLVQGARHLEVQVLGDGQTCRHLHLRDCSLQRRQQKVLEEAPPAGLAAATAAELAEQAAAALQALGYRGPGTVEFLHGADGRSTLLEVNARLQVEHGITELITGVDLVQAQLRLAGGASLAQVLPDVPAASGVALEARICAEDPVTGRPSPGRLGVFELASGEGVRVESGLRAGDAVLPAFDPLLALLLVHGENRNEALYRMANALLRCRVDGVQTNIPALLEVLAADPFLAARHDTGTWETVVARRLRRS